MSPPPLPSILTTAMHSMDGIGFIVYAKCELFEGGRVASREGGGYRVRQGQEEGRRTEDEDPGPNNTP